VTLTAEVELRARRAVLENALEHDGLARSGPVLARLLASEPSLRPRAEELRTLVATLVAEAEGLPVGELADRLDGLGGPETRVPKATRSEGPEMPELPGARDGQVVLRMAPFPSGGLHIGSGRMLFVNQYYRERYGGRLLLVFDDTVGSAEKRVEPEFFELILGDLELAGVRPDEVLYKSDRIPNHYPWAVRVIERRGAYVCRCPPELLRENRLHGRACPERSQAPEEALAEWQKMLDGAYGPGEAVLRLRTDLADPDPAFRDRVLFRISELDHPRVGHRYRVWPLLEFSWAVDDVELGVTHVLRGKDLVMEDRMQRYIWELLGVQGPPFLHWGILRIREAKVAKSKSYAEVKSGVYDGWADPRTWSLRSLDRRGISMEALRRFTLSFGLSLSDIEVPAETLYAENRQRLDASTVRRAFVAEPIRLDVDGYPFDLAETSLANHPDRADLGRRTVRAGPAFYLARADLLAHAGEEVRLKDLVNVRLPSDVPESGGTASGTFTSRPNQRLPRLQWVGAGDAVPVDVIEIDGGHRRGLGEGALRGARSREIFQFERYGFVRVDGDRRDGEEPVRVVFGHP